MHELTVNRPHSRWLDFHKDGYLTNTYMDTAQLLAAGIYTYLSYLLYDYKVVLDRFLGDSLPHVSQTGGAYILSARVWFVAYILCL